MAKVDENYPGKVKITDDELKQQAIAQAQAKVSKKNTPQNEAQKYPSEIIELPSKGLLYPESSALATGRVEMKYMTAKEEDILTSQNLIKNGTVIDALLKSLIIGNGEGYAVNYNDLIVGDKNAIMIAARVLGYGGDYPCEMAFPSCEAKQKLDINLTELENKPWNESLVTPHSNEFSFTLPASKRVITFKILSHGDEKSIESEVKRMKKRKIGQTGVSYNLTSRLKKMITSVDSDTDPIKINSFVENEFLSRDSLAFRNYLAEINPDVDMTIFFECTDCGHEDSSLQLPMNVNFFWPRA